MSVLSGSSAIGFLAEEPAAGGYLIERSLRFNSSDSAYLSRTPSSAGNRKTWTWAGWVKRSDLSSVQGVFSSSTGAIEFYGTYINITETSGYSINTSAVFRDPSAWYHFVIAFDTTQATDTNRVKIYQNGIQQTQFFSTTWPVQNTDYGINSTTLHQIGESRSLSRYFSGYLADIHFIDGQALTPSSFGEFDANNVWQPKAYSGTYGTNGFRLPFSDNSAATATTLGKDSAGSNNWTPNNLSVTAGAGNDSLVDSPTSPAGQTDSGAGGTVVGNYATLNPLHLAPSGGGNAPTLSNGNLDVSGFNIWSRFLSLGLSSGKWYAEVLVTGNGDEVIGISQIGTPSSNAWIGSATWGSGLGYGYVDFDGKIYNNGTGSTYGNTYGTNDIIGIALDMDNGKVYFSKNGAWQNSGNPATQTNPAVSGLTGTWFIGVSNGGSGSTSSYSMNAGARPFAYTAPSGFKALCTANLPTPTIANGATAMDVKLYTGNGSTQTISGLGFSPDLVWIKRRSATGDHALYDIVRGAQLDLVSNSTAAETTQSTGLTAFNSDGFALGALAKLNTSSATYAGWCWDAGSSTVSNTQGSITSQVRANASAGFSVVTYTVTSSSQTAGHGLGIASPFIIQKRRDGTGDWYVGTTLIDGSYDILLLNTTAAKSDAVGVSAPTSTVFSTAWFGTGSENWVAYCFAPVDGYSSFGSYTGNGSADGPFVYAGFRPRWVMIKYTSGTISDISNARWLIVDSARNTYNVTTQRLEANNSNSEITDTSILDFTSNGFKIRWHPSDVVNSSGATYIYAAFAENPFSISRAR